MKIVWTGALESRTKEGKNPSKIEVKGVAAGEQTFIA